jgi:hypothetical protein
MSHCQPANSQVATHSTVCHTAYTAAMRSSPCVAECSNVVRLDRLSIMRVLLTSAKHLFKCVQLQASALTCALSVIAAAANQHNCFQLRAVLNTCCYFRDLSCFADHSLLSGAASGNSSSSSSSSSSGALVSSVVHDCCQAPGIATNASKRTCTAAHCQ